MTESKSKGDPNESMETSSFWYAFSLPVQILFLWGFFFGYFTVITFNKLYKII